MSVLTVSWFGLSRALIDLEFFTNMIINKDINDMVLRSDSYLYYLAVTANLYIITSNVLIWHVAGLRVVCFFGPIDPTHMHILHFFLRLPKYHVE